MLREGHNAIGLIAPARAGSQYPVAAPPGWINFCAENPGECSGVPTQPRDAVITLNSWKELNEINRLVNETIQPMSDMHHWGMDDKWSIPTDGYGDCEDFALLKRKMLIEAGWRREALLMTLVKDRQRGEWHAVLTVKSDAGDFILDNKNKAIVLATEAGYRFIRRQSQSDPNTWVSLESAD